MKIKRKLVFLILPIIFILLFFSKGFIHWFVETDRDIRELAKENVNMIQDYYNNREYLKIYNKGTSDFRKITSEKNFILLMKRKEEVLGRFIKSDLLASNVVNSNVVILTYRSTYKNYSLIEEFQFIRESKDGDLELGTYFIDDGGKRGEVIKR